MGILWIFKQIEFLHIHYNELTQYGPLCHSHVTKNSLPLSVMTLWGPPHMTQCCSTHIHVPTDTDSSARSQSVPSSVCVWRRPRVCTVYCDHYPALTLWWFQLINVDIQQSIMSGANITEKKRHKSLGHDLINSSDKTIDYESLLYGIMWY